MLSIFNLKILVFHWLQSDVESATCKVAAFIPINKQTSQRCWLEETPICAAATARIAGCHKNCHHDWWLMAESIAIAAVVVTYLSLPLLSQFLTRMLWQKWLSFIVPKYFGYFVSTGKKCNFETFCKNKETKISMISSHMLQHYDTLV